MLLRMTDINKFYNGNQVLSHVSLTVEDHDRIGLVGVGLGDSSVSTYSETMLSAFW